MLAIQAAAIVVMRKRTLPASSFAEAQLNYALLHSISVSGYLPVSFNLLCLRNFGRKSWYIYLLTIATFVSSIVTFVMAELEWNDPNGIASSGTTPDCGTIDPAAFCPLYLTRYPLTWSSSNRLPFCATIVVLLSFEKLRVHQLLPVIWIMKQLGRAKDYIVTKQYEHLRKYNKDFEPTTTQVFNIRAYFTFLVHLVINVIYLKYFVDQFTDLSSFSSVGVIDTSNWGFGQIVAVTVWCPVLFEYFNLEFSKPISHLITRC